MDVIYVLLGLFTIAAFALSFFSSRMAKKSQACRAKVISTDAKKKLDGQVKKLEEVLKTKEELYEKYLGSVVDLSDRPERQRK